MKFRFKTDNTKDTLFNLLGHVRTRVFLAEDLYIDVGRFSIGIVSRLRLHSNAGFRGMAAKIGDYCEFSECDVMLGGEHNNSHPINLNFSASPVFQKLLMAGGVDVRHGRKGPVLIGDGVVVGYGATILSGVSIGDGVVIGAGAVVTSDCAPFSIYGGNPAKNIKQRNIDRAEFERFMHCSVEGAYNLLTGQQAQEIEQDADRDNRVVLRIQYLDPVKGGGYGYQVLGALINGQHLPLTEGTDFYNYCMQAKLAPGSELGWDSNPLGLAMKREQ